MPHFRGIVPHLEHCFRHLRIALAMRDENGFLRCISQKNFTAFKDSKVKTIYKSGKQKLIQGDALEVLPKLCRRGEKFHAVITDPPYSSGGLHMSTRAASTSSKYQSSDAKKKHPDFLGDNRDQRSYLAWSTMWLSYCHELIVDRGIVCLFSDWRQLPTVSDALQAAGFIWQGVASWDKVNARPKLGGFRQQCEFIVWGSKGKAPGTGVSLPGSFRVSLVSGTKRVHAAQKPVELISEVCRCAAHHDQPRILDPFAGSGTTLLAARSHGIQAVGVEQSAEIATLAVDRLKDISGL